MMKTERSTILVIDDEDAVRQSLADYLEDLGYRILTAENGRAGVELFERERADLVLVDLRMPEMDGLEVLAHITKISPDTPLIVVSGTGVITDAVEALHLGAWDYLLKPIQNFSVLAHAVESAIEKARLKRENRQYQQHLEQMVAERTKELEQTAENLRENEENFRSILDNIQTGIVIVERNTRKIVYVNPAAAEMAEISATNIVGCICTNILCPTKKGECPVIDFGQEVKSSERLLKTCDGRQIPILKTITRMVYRGRDCLLESFFDLSAQKAAEAEKKALEAQLVQAQKMEALGTLSGGIAHDFNNILGVILGCTELAILHTPENNRGLEFMGKVQDACDRAADLVQQILTFSSQRELLRQPLRVSLIVKEIGKMLRAALPSTIDIRLEIDQNSGMTLADPAQIHQIVMNLGTNAAHAMQDAGGLLRLALNNVELDGTEADMPSGLVPGAYLKLSVSDTGYGIEAAILERIFDPYFTTKNPNEGTGLGLAMVMGIVKKYEGAISVSSEPHKGTRFDVFFPRVEDAEEPDQPESPEAIVLRGTERILFVDDEPELGTAAMNMLSSLGYRVHFESESHKALQRFMEDPRQFDLVISDVTMPEMTGDALAREFLQIRPDIPIILCTGFSGRLNESQAKSMGVRKFLNRNS